MHERKENDSAIALQQTTQDIVNKFTTNIAMAVKIRQEKFKQFEHHLQNYFLSMQQLVTHKQYQITLLSEEC